MLLIVRMMWVKLLRTSKLFLILDTLKHLPMRSVMVVFLEMCMTPDMAFWLILISDEKQC